MVANVHEAEARARKAAIIAKVLSQHGATAAQVRVLPAEGRRMAEELAEVREASDATWAAVAVLLERLAALPTNPFDAFPKGA